MKKVLQASLMAVALLVGSNVSAQDSPIQLGVKAGVNLSNFGGDVEGTKAKVGFNAGVTLDYNFTPNVALLTGLEFTTKGAKSKEYEVEEMGIKGSAKASTTAMFIQLPVHVGYKLPVTETMKVVFHAGPYAAYGIGGKDKTEITINGKTAEEKTDTFGKEALKKFDFGVGIGAGLEFGQIGVGLGWDFGLADLNRGDGSVKTQNGYLSLGYKF